MTTLLILSGHVLFDVVFGWALLRVYRHERSWTETLLTSVLLGMYVETLSVATLMFLGVPLVTASLGMVIGMGGFTVAVFYRYGLDRNRPSIERPKWYEWALLVAVAEKVLFVVWQLTRTHTYFDDALTHWSGRARALFGAVNWSFDPTLPSFLAGNIGNNSYPLQLIIWRALSAKLNGQWNEIISRADGLVFFVVVVGMIWLVVWRFSDVRWLAAAAAFIASAVPLHAWHAAAGYSDIAVEAFVVTALAALLRAEWLLAGVMAAGAAWSKNEGLVLYFPTLLAAAVLMQWEQETNRLKWRNVASFVSGFATIAPWFLFNYTHALGVTSGQGKIAFHQDAFRLLWKAFIESPSSSVLWISIFGFAVYSSVAMFKDRTGRALLAAFSICLAGIAAIFSLTDAYMFLSNEMTIHRVTMQFSGMAIMVVTYGLWLKTQPEAWFKSTNRLHTRKPKKTQNLVRVRK